MEKILRNMTIEIKNQCVQRCIHCSSASCYESQDGFGYPQINDIIFQACRLGLRKVSISGGEPFLHPQLEYIVDLMKAYELDVSLYSCGIIGTPEKLESIPEEMFDRLKARGLDKLVISLHGIGDICDKITTLKGSFQYIFRSIRNALKAGLPTEIHFVPTTENIADFKNVINFVYSIGIRNVSILRLVPQGRADKTMVPSREKIVDLLNSTIPLEAKYPGLKIRKGHPWKATGCCCDDTKCAAAEDKVVIMANGQVVPCEAFKFTAANQGTDNIFDKKLQEIWDHNGLMNELRLQNLIRNEMAAEQRWQNMWTEGLEEGKDYYVDDEGFMVLGNPENADKAKVVDVTFQ